MIFEERPLKLSISGSSPKELVDEKDSRSQGFKESSEMLKNYKKWERGWCRVFYYRYFRDNWKDIPPANSFE
ncbi:MAG: hypothetical protein HY739_10475 [Desulfobacterales bacterium]|nr:hypothetical protein [Desulfobacterales bacterium]